VGAIKRLSAAVVVNHRKVVAADGKSSFEPLKKEDIEQIQALVREAMGYKTDRGDTLNVANAVFSTEEREVIPELPIWQQPENIALAKDLGKGVGAALLILYGLFGLVRPTLRKISVQPEPPALTAEAAGGAGAAAATLADGSGTYDAPPANRLEAARLLAQQDPRVVANVVRNWVGKE
jgi:flagellar M-ring protein FliF